MTYLIFWGVIFVITLIAEIASMQLISIWFTVGSVGAFIAAMKGVGFPGQLGIFVAISLVLLLVTRPLLARLRVNQEPRTNADKNIGETAVIIEEVDPALGTGRAKIGGVDWIAVSETGEILPAEAVVIVTRVEGAKLFVRRA
ncbi:MAG: NfeD family protein [Oscillospiraceae bacterium]|nr:NfeD family protein [Oscillospiraceae bacterium]